MNDQLARTLGIEFVRKRRAPIKSDLEIRKIKNHNSYSFSFSELFADKLGGYVRFAVAKNRLYIAPGCKDEYSFKITGKSNGARGYVHVSASTIGFIDKFCGVHMIEYYKDLDAYYIRARGGDNDA